MSETSFMITNSLEAYRINNALTYKQLGEHLGYPKGTVWRWCNDQSEPGKFDRKQIEERTNGAVVFYGFSLLGTSSNNNPTPPP